ncbi:MAG: cell division protein [Rhodospirillales bacterium]|nr:cell division protein [Rhodospirillales bacterium]
MARHRSEIPFRADDTSRYLPWLLAFMVYFAALAVSGLFILNDVARKIDRGVENTLTIQIPISDDQLTDDRKVGEALGLLRRMNGVERAEALDREKIAELLRPWLGENAGETQLPLPRVIDVTISRRDGFHIDNVRKALGSVLPGISIDDHGVWLKGFLRAVRATKLVAITVVLLICLITIITVIFTTRAGLGLHRETIEIMHFVGARDTYVARQFAIRFSLMGIKGALIGIAIAVPTLLLISFIAGDTGIGLVPKVELSTAGWTGIGLLVPGSAIIALTTARITVMKSLARMV